jgi:hypothetical protein
MPLSLHSATLGTSGELRFPRKNIHHGGTENTEKRKSEDATCKLKNAIEDPAIDDLLFSV